MRVNRESSAAPARLFGCAPLVVFVLLAAGAWAARPAGAADCNNNGVDDAEEIANGDAEDCNNNGIPDVCDLTQGPYQDCNGNNVPDVCDVQSGTSPDLNGNEIPDECEPDCNDNGVPDEIDILLGNSEDCNNNNLPDECDISNGLSQDCNNNGIPDLCDRLSGNSADCNGNSLLDECEVAAGSVMDCNNNIIPDECEPDCNNNDIPDSCDIADLTSLDCNENGVPDSCEIADGSAQDCNGNGIPDQCDTLNPDEDCNLNGLPDVCEVLLLFEQSNVLTNIGTGSPRTYTLVDAPDTGGDVTLTFQTIGDFAAFVEYITVTVNGVEVGRVFEFNAFDCPDEADTEAIIVPKMVWNDALQGTPNMQIRMTASSAVDPMPLLCTTWIRVFVEYQAVTPADSDGNGEIDACEGSQCPTDLATPNGVTDVFDLFVVLNNWGTSGTGADLAAPNNVVDVFDLFELLSHWGPCAP